MTLESPTPRDVIAAAMPLPGYSRRECELMADRVLAELAKAGYVIAAVQN